jgi:hypothetical protein
MILTLRNFLGESNYYDSGRFYDEKFYIGISSYDGLDMKNWIARRLGISSFEFISYYSPKLHNSNQMGRSNRCWIVGIHNPYFTPSGYFKELKLRKPINKKINYDKKFSVIDTYVFGDEVDYLNISKNGDDMVSFLPSNRVSSVNEKGLDPYDNNYRQDMKFGRFFRRYSIFEEPLDQSIEFLTNVYKSFQNKEIFDRLELVEGEDIRHWYLEDNYVKGGGILNNSCMKSRKSQKRFDIYVENPDVCKLLILKSKLEPDKIQARALIWETNKGTYMDRVYTRFDHDQIHFLSYAVHKDWMTINSINDELKVKVKRDYGRPSENPYMDTFKYFYPNDKILSNMENPYKNISKYTDHD